MAYGNGDDRLQGIARSFAGHILTDADVRKQFMTLFQAQNDQGITDLVNDTTHPEPPLDSGDVAAFLEALKASLHAASDSVQSAFEQGIVGIIFGDEVS